MKTIGIVFRTAILLIVSCSLMSAQAVQSGYVNVGPDKIYYETAGAGPVIILIHDGIVHSAIWDEQFAEFAKSHKVIRYDRRGYGRSSAPTVAYSHMDDLNSLFAQWKIERACLMGMSSGGRLAIDFTLQYPQKVNALVLVGAVVGGFPYTDHMLTRGGHLPAGLTDMEKSRAWYVAEDPYEIYAENKAAKERVKEFVKKYPHREGPPAKRDEAREGARAKQDEAPAKPSYTRLGEIKIPALILVGEFDMPDCHAHAGAINAGIANSKRAIIPKSGHLIPIEQPVLFNDAVMKFLKDLT